MKKLIRVSVISTLVIVALVATGSIAMAAPGGAPEAHGLTGAEFGDLISDLAPINGHVSNSENAGGKPAAHGLTGAEFGDLISDLAPINDHVSH
jgi:hypothetical protein